MVPGPKASLVTKFAHRYSIEPDKLMDILKATAFKQRGDLKVSNEQMAALLVVADQYGLNPFTREIFAFPDKQNGIVPVVGVDGWNRISNQQEAFNGMTFNASAKSVRMDTDCKECPEWMEVVIYRKDRDHPIIVREYLDEVYRPAFVGKDNYKLKGQWQTHNKRMLRHKTMIQGQRIAFGFAGIYDEDEAERIIEGEIIEVNDFQSTGTKALNQSIKATAGKTQQTKAPDAQKEATPDEGKVAFPEDFDLEQPDTTTAATGQNEVTIVDVRAKLRDLEGKVKKAKTEKQWAEINEIAITTLDLLNAIVMKKKDYDGIANTLNGYLEQAEKALGV